MLTADQKAAVMAEAPSPEQWRLIFDAPAAERPWLTDEEAAEAADVTARTLRTLQANGLIRSEKAPTGVPGGVRRMWRRDMVYLAAVAGELMRQFNWSVAKAGGILLLVLVRRDLKGAIQPLIFDALSEDEPDGLAAKLVRRLENDWFLSIHDGKFVFLKVPEATREFLAAAHAEFPLGVFSGDSFVPVIYGLEDAKFFEWTAEVIGREDAERQLKEVEACRSAYAHSRAGVWVDISMPIRAASRRMRGLEVRFIDDVAMDVLQASWHDSLKGGDR